MYIAFKWLVALSMVLWLGLCTLDIYMREFEKTTYSTQVKLYKDTHKYENVSNFIVKVTDHWTYAQPTHTHQYTHHNIAYLHYVMFLGGAIAISVFNKKKAIIIYTKNKLETICFREVFTFFKNAFCNINLKKLAMHVNFALIKLSSELRRVTKNLIPKVTAKIGNEQNLNSTLLKRVKEIWLDRKTLGQLLIAAINENKNIRMQCKLESLAKNRLARYVEESQNLIKENRTRYVSFQQLYLVTHRENILLKSHILKLSHEKEEAEKNLVELINQIYQSKNNDLKASCTRFIVTQDNLLNGDVNAEIQKFLQKSKEQSTSVCSQSVSNLRFKLSNSNSLPEVLHDDNKLNHLLCDGPKLRGLPGEYVWTVKDKNGIIEKLYEYNYETDYDNGDAIRRIREYSVYFDKDCLLDHTNLPIPTCPSLSASATRIRLDVKPIQNHRFLSGSKEFKMFLRNKPILIPRAQAPPLTYG